MLGIIGAPTARLNEQLRLWIFPGRLSPARAGALSLAATARISKHENLRSAFGQSLLASSSPTNPSLVLSETHEDIPCMCCASLPPS